MGKRTTVRNTEWTLSLSVSLSHQLLGFHSFYTRAHERTHTHSTSYSLSHSLADSLSHTLHMLHSLVSYTSTCTCRHTLWATYQMCCPNYSWHLAAFLRQAKSKREGHVMWTKAISTNTHCTVLCMLIQPLQYASFQNSHTHTHKAIWWANMELLCA